MAKKIEIVEVGPRDGFQNLKEYLPVEKKLEIIDSLIDAGVKHMQIILRASESYPANERCQGSGRNLRKEVS